MTPATYGLVALVSACVLVVSIGTLAWLGSLNYRKGACNPSLRRKIDVAGDIAVVLALLSFMTAVGCSFAFFGAASVTP